MKLLVVFGLAVLLAGCVKRYSVVDPPPSATTPAILAPR
jgi:hypothetical protein